MKKRWVIIGMFFSIFLLLLTGVSFGEKAQPLNRYDGTTVTVVLHSGHFEVPWRDRANRLKAMFGINLEVVGITVGDLFDKEMLELASRTGAYDLLMFNPAWMGEFVDYLMPLDEFMGKWDPAWSDIHPGFQKWQNMYGGKRYSMTMDGDIFMLYYRKDLFESPKEKAAFKQKYGYDLMPPDTWDQLLDIAAFFRRDTNGDGKIDFWGYADQGKRGRSFYWYLLRYLPYNLAFDPGTGQDLFRTSHFNKKFCCPFRQCP